MVLFSFTELDGQTKIFVAAELFDMKVRGNAEVKAAKTLRREITRSPQ